MLTGMMPGHAAPPAGSVIGNWATMAYFDPASGLNSNLRSNTVNVIVQPLEALTLTRNQDIVHRPGSTFHLAHRLINTGNTPADYLLSVANLAGDHYDLADLGVVYDGNANGIADSGEPALGNGADLRLAAGQWADLVVTGTIPGTTPLANAAALQLTATSRLQQISAANTDTVTTHDAAALHLVTAASTLTPARDEMVTFTLRASNVGGLHATGMPITLNGAPASMIVIYNDVPANTTLVELSGPANGIPLYHLLGDPPMLFSSAAPADLGRVDAVGYGFAGFMAGQTSVVNLKVKINSLASGALSHQAQVFYTDGVHPAVIGAESNQVMLGMAALAPAIKYFRNGNFDTEQAATRVGMPLYVQAEAAACNTAGPAIETIDITLSSALTTDTEVFAATETAANSGQFRVTGDVMTADGDLQPAISGNGILEVKKGDTLTASIQGCGATMTQTAILIDPAGIVFDSKTNAPLSGATVSLIDVAGAANGGNPGGAARVFDMDGVTAAPSTVVTGADGFYQFPLVGASTYRLLVTPPGAYRFPSTLAAGLLPAGRRIDVAGSYGGVFPVNEITGAVMIDIPLDAGGEGLFVQKTASRRTAEIAEFVDYTVKIKNVSGAALAGITLSDALPAGFAYQPGTARLNGAGVADPAGGRGPALRFAVGNLGDGVTATLSYRVRIGPGALQGDGVNRAQAGSALPLPKLSNLATAEVKVQGGVFSDRGYLLGKVYADCNGNRIQDTGEAGLPGVRLYLEDGSFVIADGDGKYSFYGLSPRTHVLKLDTTTLPAGARLAVLANRNAGDAGSRFVDLKHGELHKADFAVDGCDEALAAAITLRKRSVAGDELARGLKTEMTADGQAAALGDVRALPASGVLGGETPAALPATAENDAVTPPTAVAARAAPAPDAPPLAADADEQPGFIGLGDRDVLPMAQTNLRIKGPARAALSLLVNGVAVPDDRIGTRLVLEDRRIEVREYIGLALRPGENVLTVSAADAFGNPRGSHAITVIAPGELARLVIDVPQAKMTADGSSLGRLRLRLVDGHNVPVTARTAVTLETSLGLWQIDDLDKREPAVQTFVEGGQAEFALRAPAEPGEARVRISSGRLRAETHITFLPQLRPLLAVGVIEGAFNLRKLDSGALVPARAQDNFERELRQFSQENGKGQAGARAALFLKGKIKGEYLLTLGYDSDKETQERLFRDIQPDQFYPVYGDAAVKGFDAQSTGRLYVRVDKQRSYLLYGDYTTQTAVQPARGLSAYNRSLNGLKHHYENSRIAANVFASRDSTRQVVEELPANGTSGPYTLSNDNAIENSERIEIITRDRNQSAVILKSVPQTRFSDYEIEAFTGRILFRAPVPGVDADLNPNSIRVTYEVDQGGAAFWVTGMDAQVKLNGRVEVGGSWIDDRNPQDPATLQSVNATLRLAEQTVVMGELVRTDKLSVGDGHGERIEVRHDGENLQATLFAGRTDAEFDNPSASLSKGRAEAGARASYKIDERTRLVGEAIRTEDVVSDDRRDGVMLGAERSFDNNLRLEAGVRHAREHSAAADIDFTSLRAKLSAALPGLPAASVYGEAEREIDDDNGVLAAGGEYRFTDRGRLYARHEFISSLAGPYALNADQQQNTSVLGIDTAYMQDGQAYSEYRVREAISGREGQAAIGLRNLWRIAEGTRLNTSIERIHAVAGGADNESTALTGAIEYTRNPLWKGTARLELYNSDLSRSLLNSLGLAYKLGDDWTLLGKTILSITDNRSPGAGQRLLSRLQLGLAYRETARNVWSGLSRYEYKREDDDSNPALAVRRDVHIVSLHANYQPSNPLIFTARYAAKRATEDSNAIESRASAQLLSGRATYDIDKRWDAGVIISGLFSGGYASTQYGMGAEIGRVLQENLWMSVGYNFFGYSDEDLTGQDYTNRGPYLRLRFKFDENLFSGRAM
ncbi:MAG: hypothetical protein AABZ84_04915 [Pseudomonadota bacterium]